MKKRSNVAVIRGPWGSEYGTTVTVFDEEGNEIDKYEINDVTASVTILINSDPGNTDWPAGPPQHGA